MGAIGAASAPVGDRRFPGAGLAKRLGPTVALVPASNTGCRRFPAVGLASRLGDRAQLGAGERVSNGV